MAIYSQLYIDTYKKRPYSSLIGRINKTYIKDQSIEKRAFHAKYWSGCKQVSPRATQGTRHDDPC